MRTGFLLLLFITLLVIWNGSRPVERLSAIRGMARLGESFFLGFVGMQLTLVLLAAPAATAGSICLDRARGTLTHMLVTDLSSAEIVLGKLASRLVPVLGLLACALPLMEILALVGGLDPNALLGAFVVALGIAVLGSSLALFFSLWVGKTHEAILVTYAVWGLWLLWTPIVIDCRGSVSPGVFLDASALGRSVLAGIRSVLDTEIGSVARLRIVPRGDAGPLGDVGGHRSFPPARKSSPAIPSNARRRDPCSSASSSDFARGRRLPEPSLDWNPVFWREWHRSKPSRWSRAIVALYFALATTFSLTTVAFGGTAAAPWLNAVQVSVGLLILSVDRGRLARRGAGPR